MSDRIIPPQIYDDLLGKPWRETSCYALAVEVYNRLGLPIERDPARLLAAAAWSPVEWNDLRAGDLILCAEKTPGVVDHVAVYIGERRILHSHETHGVIVSRLGAYERAGFVTRAVRPKSPDALGVERSRDGVTVVSVPDAFNPGERTVAVVALGEGSTVADYAPAWANLAIGAEGRIEDWSRPVEVGEAIAFTRAPEIAAAALNAFLEGVFIGFGLMLAGNALTSVLMPGQPPEEQATPTWNLAGLRNTAQVGLAQPVVYGSHRVGGNIISAFQKIDAEGRAVLWMLVLLSRGPIQSIGGITEATDGLTGNAIPDGIQIDGNPASSYDAEVSIRLGDRTQDAIDGFRDNTTAIGYDVLLDDGAPFVHVTSQAIDAADVQISFPSGLYDLDNGVPTYWFAEFRYRYRQQGSATWSAYSPTLRFDASRISPTLRQFTINLPATAVYEIEVERTTPWPEANADRESKSVLIAVNEITRDSLSYPSKALLGVKILGTDQVSGSLPTITADVEGRKVWVWDGVSETSPNFGSAPVYTTNPAWNLLDLLLSQEYGMGRGGRLTLDNIDLGSFDDWADYCDEVPEVGAGKRAELGLVVDEVQSGWELVAGVARSSFARAMIIGNRVTMIPDRASSTVGVFSVGNMADFNVEWLGKLDRVNAVEVQFLNAETGYEADWQKRYDATEIFTNGNPVVKRSFQGVGVTRAVQAARLAQRDLNRAELLRRRIEWTAGVESLHLLPMDVVRVQHDATGRGVGGRIKASTSTTVKVNAKVSAIPAGAVITVRTYSSALGYDIVQERTVTATDGTDESTLTVSLAWTVNPAVGDPFAFGSDGTAYPWPKLFQIDSISLTPDLKRRITATEYNVGVYADDPGEIESFTDTMPDPRAFPARISRGAVREIGLVTCDDGCARVRLRVEWDTESKWQRGDVWYAFADQTNAPDYGWQYVGRADETITFDVAPSTAYVVSVAPVSASGTRRRADQGTFFYAFPTGREAAPAAPGGVAAATADLDLTVEATPPANLADVAGYEFRYSATSSGSWAASALLARSTSPRWTGVSPSVGAFKVYARTVSAAGVYSTTEATATVTPVVAPSTYKLVETVTDSVTFPGTKTDTVVSGGALVLDTGDLSGTYVSSDLTDTATRAVWDVTASLQAVDAYWSEACTRWADASRTWATYLLDGSEAFSSATWEQAGFPFDGLISNVFTFSGWPDVVADLTPTIEQRFNGGAWSRYVPSEVSGFTAATTRVTLRRPHTRYVPQVTAIVGRSYDFPGVYYGSFYDNSDQAAGAANTAYALEFNTTAEANGVSIANDGSGNPTRITFTYAGTYNVQFSAQFAHSGGSDADVDLWLAKNGTNVDDTNSKFTIKGGHESVQAWNFIQTVDASDYLELKWSSTDTGVSVEAFATGTTPTRPAVPSTILTVTPVQSAGVGGSGGGGGGGAPTDASYVTLGTNATLTNERVLTAGTGITLTDGGAGGALTIAASGFAPSTVPYLTVGNTTDLSAERAIAVADGLTYSDGGANSSFTISGIDLVTTSPASGARNVIKPSASGYAGLTVQAVTNTDSLFEVQNASGGATMLVYGTGDVTIKGTLSMDTGAIQSVLDPVNAQDAATKNYTDGKVAKSTVTTKGDLLVGTASATVARLGVGTNDYVLTADSTTAEGVAWKPASGGGGSASLPDILKAVNIGL